MSPAESAQPLAAVHLPEQLLEDGEVVVLAMKPSGWYAVLLSAPVMLLMTGVLLGTWVAIQLLAVSMPIQQRDVALFCGVLVSLRLAVALLQWQGTLYVLTNRRMLRVRGLLKPGVYHVPLRQVEGTELTATAGERFFCLGSLTFRIDGAPRPGSAWINIAHPEDVRRVVEETIHHGR